MEFASTQRITLRGTAATPRAPALGLASADVQSGDDADIYGGLLRSNGVSYLGNVRLLFNTAISGVNACYVMYAPATNSLYMESNAGNGAADR